MSSRSSWTSETTAVSASTSISSGHATISSSALGTRSRVASPVRGSTTTVCQPSGRASAQSASAMSPAPTTTSRGGGETRSANTVRPSSSRSVVRVADVVVPALAQALSPATTT